MPKALICRAAGDWREVLELREVSLPAAPLPGMARVKLLAAAVHPSDFGMIAGTYGKAREFPCVMGREGVGEVVALGAGATSVSVGDYVRLPEAGGVWAELSDVPSVELYPLPKNLPPEALALSFVNPPTALRVLEDFANLSAGDAVLTNAGKSAVSVAFIQLAAARGLKPHAVVRNKIPEDEALLKKLGAEVVWDETDEYFKKIRVSLALNQVGGKSALSLLKALREGGVCVTIGGASREDVRFPTRELIFNDVVLRGFWMDRTYRTHTRAEILTMLEKIWSALASGTLTQPVAATFPLSDFVSALTAAQAPSRFGKILFVNT